MTLLCQCNQCEYIQPESLPFKLAQRTDELDEDGDPIEMDLHFCSWECVSNYALAATLDLEAD